MGNSPLNPPRMAHSTTLSQDSRRSSSPQGVEAKRAKIDENAFSAYRSIATLDDDCLRAIFEHFSTVDVLRFAHANKHWQAIAITNLASVRTLNTAELIDETLIRESFKMGGRETPSLIEPEPFRLRFEHTFKMGVGTGLRALTFAPYMEDVGDELFCSLPALRFDFDFRVEADVMKLVRERAPQLRSLAFESARVTPATVNVIGGFSELRALRFTKTDFDWRPEATYERGIYLHDARKPPCRHTKEAIRVCERSLVGALNALSPHLREFRANACPFRGQVLTSAYMPALAGASLLEVVDISGDPSEWLPAFIGDHASGLVEFSFNHDRKTFAEIGEPESDDDEANWEDVDSDDDEACPPMSVIALLMKHCPKLRRVSIRNPRESIPHLQLLHGLTHLNIGPVDGDPAMRVTDDDVLTMCEKNPDLRVLCINGNGDDGMRDAPKISWIIPGLFGAFNRANPQRNQGKGDLTARAFSSGVASLHCLEVLSVDSTPLLDGDTLESVCRANASTLRAVRFTRLGAKLDGGRLSILARECPRLEFVQIDHSKGPPRSHTTPDVIRAFVEAVLESDWPYREIRVVVKNFDDAQYAADERGRRCSHVGPGEAYVNPNDDVEEIQQRMDFSSLRDGVEDFGAVQVFFVQESEQFP